MYGEEERKYLQVLELPPEASPTDVRKAYLFLKDLYSQESIVTIPLRDEVSDEEQQQILSEVEEAYYRLISRPGQHAGKLRDPRPLKVDYTTFSGRVLKEIRQQLNIDLQDLALATNIQTQYLEDIENENYASLPVYVYTRGYVSNYAKCLSLDARKVAEDYMSRYSAWKNGG